MNLPATPSVTFSLDRLIHVSEGESVHPHASLAYKIVVGLDAPISLEFAGQRQYVQAVLIPPGVEHGIRALGLSVGAFLRAGLATTPFAMRLQEPRILEARDASWLRDLAAERLLAADFSSHASFVDTAFRQLHGDGAAERLDRRVANALESLRATPDLPLARLSGRAGLSGERLRHLVAEQTGYALRSHRLWARTLRGVQGLLAGQSAAAAAASAGFSDQAHFSRSFRRAFGRSPSSVRGQVLLG